MARRSLLNEADRKRFFETPDDEASLIRLYSLSDVDRDFVLSKRGARNQLGMAVQLGLLRYPGFGLRLENEPPAPLIQFLARQIGAPWPVFQEAHPGFRGDGATIASTSAVRSAFPRFLVLCTN